MKRIVPPIAVGVVLALLLAACGRDVVDAGPIEADVVDTEDPDTDETTEDEPTDEAPGDDADAEPDATDAADDEPSDAKDEEPTESTEDEGGEAETTDIRLYFAAPGGGTLGRADPFLVSVHREIPSTPGIAAAALEELVDGPSTDDQALIDGVASEVPDDTLVLGVNIDDGLATIDLSREFEAGGGSLSMFLRLAQVVYTATQFPTVDEVEFMLDGRPVTVFSGEGIEIDGPASRADLVDLLPTVFVDSPAAGAEVRGDLRMTGMAAVFEAEFQYRLETADGTVIEEGFAMTDHGHGWGSFDVTIGVDVDEPQEATLTVWEVSAKDGSIQAKRVTPVTLLP
jgi:hypothetical protein